MSDFTLPLGVGASSPLILSRGIRIRRQMPYQQQDRDVITEVIQNDCYRLRELLPYCDMGDGGLNIVDVGAHIGTFSVHASLRREKCKIACVEVCPENIPVLFANVGHFARIYHAACLYSDREIALLNSVKEDGIATGGSRVTWKEQIAEYTEVHDASNGNLHYRQDLRPLQKITLEQIREDMGMDVIHILKLDCEGCEANILAGADMSKVKIVVGESHFGDDFGKFVAEHFPDWPYEEYAPYAGSSLRLFRLTNPRQFSIADFPKQKQS